MMQGKQIHDKSNLNSVPIPDELAGVYLFGVEFPFSPDITSFLSACRANKPGAIRIKFSEFWPLWRCGKQADEDFKYPHNDVVCLNPGCFQQLPSSARMMLPDEERKSGPPQIRSTTLSSEQLEMAQSARCPFCGGIEAAVVCDNMPPEEIEEADLDRLWLLWKEHAKWLHNERPSSNLIVCEKCYKKVYYRDSYIIAGYPYCEDCAKPNLSEENLIELKRSPHYFGHGVVRRARKLADNVWHPIIPCGGVFKSGDLGIRITFPLSFGPEKKTNVISRVFIFRNNIFDGKINNFWDVFAAAIRYLAPDVQLRDSIKLTEHIIPEIGYVPNEEFDPLKGGELKGLFGCGTIEPFVVMIMSGEKCARAVFEDKDATIRWFFFEDNKRGHGIIYAL